MGKDENDKEKKKAAATSTRNSNERMLVGVVWSCSDMKLVISCLLLIFALLSIAPLLPSLAGFLSPSDLHSGLSHLSSPSPPPSIVATTTAVAASTTVIAATTVNVTLSSSSSSSSSSTPSDPTYHPMMADEADQNATVVKRVFNPVGSAAYLFIQMGAYRGGPHTFAVVGLASKPLHVYGKPQFRCEWVPHSDVNNNNNSVTVAGAKILPDWGYGRVYTVVVVNCTFPTAVGIGAGAGGRLILHASATAGDRPEKLEVLVEKPGEVIAAAFSAPPRYDYLYCGSPLYGNLSPQRVREWVAYHARLFGARAHFVIYDAGGVHPAVAEVLRPWIEKGVVTLQDVREQERFDGYYHNQFLVVNDCLHRYKFAAKWIFFFDVDEFIYVAPKSTVGSLLAELGGVTQFTIDQMPMSGKLCLSGDAGRTPRMWGIEKLVYRDVKRGVRRDRKYAIQPRNAFATGVHMSQNVVGNTLHKTERRIKYFHYHGTIADRRDPCRHFVNATELTVDGNPYVYDGTLRAIAGAVKRFELKTIGSRLRRTRQ